MDVRAQVRAARHNVPAVRGDESLLHRLGCGGLLRRHSGSAHHDGIDWRRRQAEALRPRAQQVLRATRWGADSPADGEEDIVALTDPRVGGGQNIIEAL